MWRCNQCQVSFRTEAIQSHLFNQHLRPRIGRPQVFSCGECMFSADDFERIASHCISAYHDPNRVMKGSDYETYPGELFRCLKTIMRPQGVFDGFSAGGGGGREVVGSDGEDDIDDDQNDGNNRGQRRGRNRSFAGMNDNINNRKTFSSRVTSASGGGNRMMGRSTGGGLDDWSSNINFKASDGDFDADDFNSLRNPSMTSSFIEHHRTEEEEILASSSEDRDPDYQPQSEGKKRKAASMTAAGDKKPAPKKRKKPTAEKSDADKKSNKQVPHIIHDTSASNGQQPSVPSEPINQLDLGLYIGIREDLTDSFKVTLLGSFWKPSESFIYPQVEYGAGGENRKLKRSRFASRWFLQYTWLAYTQVDGGGGLCAPCTMFNDGPVRGRLVGAPFRKYRCAQELFAKHSETIWHNKAVQSMESAMKMYQNDVIQHNGEPVSREDLIGRLKSAGITITSEAANDRISSEMTAVPTASVTAAEETSKSFSDLKQEIDAAEEEESVESFALE